MYTSQEMMTLSDDALIPNASQFNEQEETQTHPCLLYTSDAADE